MKKIFIIIGIILLIGIISLACYVKLVLPNVEEAPTLKVNITPERIKHGEYLANHITACMDCHLQETGQLSQDLYLLEHSEKEENISVPN